MARGNGCASSSSSSSNSTPSKEKMDEPFDFVLNEKESSGDASDNCSDGFGSPEDFFSSLDPLKSETGSFVGDIRYSQNDDAGATCHSAPSTLEGPSPLIIPHRGSLRRILNPTSLNVVQNAIPDLSNQYQLPPSRWPVYSINVATECSQYSHGNSDRRQLHQCYQIIFDRQQYEFCTRLFSLLDTESESFIGPECIREFVCLHCPVIRRRDDAIFGLSCGDEHHERKRGSPTFDEIWDRTIHSDPRITSVDKSTPTIHRIGIEGLMIFCRILALAHHQESQRRFASRHLQQMMRHKHGGGATRMNPNEVVVVVENPPPGPPTLISIRSLVEVEQDRVTSHSDECIHGWPFCPLPLPELDLDHYLESLFSNHLQQSRMHRQPRGKVSIEPFSSQKGDFILCFHSNGARTIVRRSYSDFEWLNAILKLHKRPGQGHLCGRVLPPFPSKQGGFLQQHSVLPKKRIQPSGSNQQKDISERAIEVAKSGIGMISSMANSFWSGYVSGSTPASSPASSLTKNKSGQPGKMSSQTDATAKTAKRMERYINYLLESNALSSSFPLNAILQASQSGLESAKLVLHDHANQKKRQRLNLAAAMSRNGPQSAASIFSALMSKTSSSILRLQGDDDTSWLRAAAHVAMALQFHGILETTGHESTSAKIQHASLPKFSTCPAGSWDDEEAGNDKGSSTSPGSGANFEVGVINVESELADEEDIGGYDMLPSPGPSEVNRVLNAGSGSDVSGMEGAAFAYEAISEQSKGLYDRKDAVVGTIKVERDIDKLRDIIQSTNHTLGKLYLSSASIQSAQDAKHVIQLNILRDVDSWGDNGGDIITQRALVNGVAALEAFNSDVEEINRSMTDDLSWQSYLAASAVGAVLEVRDAVRASRTASRAKSAAYIAADRAKKAYESCDHSSSMEKVQNAQLEASTAQSHAIHATVVEYEANLAKKRSAVSFSQDVRSWNVHRKKELLRTCVQIAKSQHEACRKAADAWESVRDGLIDSSGYSFAEAQVKPWADLMIVSPVSSTPVPDHSHANNQGALASILQTKSDASDAEEFARNSSGANYFASSSSLNDWGTGQGTFSESVTEASNSMTSVTDGFTDVCSLKESQKSEMEVSSDDVYRLVPPKMSLIDEGYFSFHQQSILFGEENPESDEPEPDHTSSVHESFHSGCDSTPDVPTRDTMSTSMQSLIDGLMAWGGDDEQGNNEESDETEDVINASSDAKCDDLLG